MLLHELKRNHLATPKCIARELRVLKLRDEQHLTFAQIGEILGVTTSAARAIYNRASRYHCQP